VSENLANRPIVVIEDSDEDFEVMLWAWRQAGVANPVHRCADAAAIVDLVAENGYGQAGLSGPYPALVLLDLNLPGTDWRETLGALRSKPWWRPVPVVVVSTSGQPATVSACYSLGASGYLTKPLDLDGFAASIARVAAYWLGTVVLPAFPTLDGRG
jgi:CheY-like chemotaxis protein